MTGTSWSWRRERRRRRFFLPGVGVIGDLERPLPFADHSAEVVLAQHSLEHVRDLPFAVREIWRVTRPGGQVVIVAPYGMQALDFANPYHHRVFDEHTPGFWTRAARTRIPEAEWWHPPQGKAWGLAGSDCSSPDVDLRCVRMEFRPSYGFCHDRRVSTGGQRDEVARFPPPVPRPRPPPRPGPEPEPRPC